MPLRYNIPALSGQNLTSLYDLNKAKIISLATCNAIYRHRPIQTDTLARVLNFADCPLESFLRYSPQPHTYRPGRRFLDLNDMVLRGVISRTSKDRFGSGKTMSLSTLCTIAEDQGVNLLDFLRMETILEPGEDGTLKKIKKVIYLKKW